jgi:putative transposase
MIELAHPRISVSRQAELLGIARSSIYYTPVQHEEDVVITRLIDEIYTEAPCYGSRKIKAALARCGYVVGLARVQALMRSMGLEAIYPKPKLSQRHPEHRVYPYLLRGVTVSRPNQVWATDITYIRLVRGWMYLVAILDWCSRYVLSWAVSTTQDVFFCLEALEVALTKGTPEIFNSDQGSQFTSAVFTDVLKTHAIQISMDGRGRVFDNIFTERLWRTIKYEEVYLHDYHTVREGKQGIGRYIEFYNHTRLHQSLNYQTPAEVHFHVKSSQEECCYNVGGVRRKMVS